MAITLFRLLSAQPMPDGEHIKIKGALHNDDWYRDSYGQNPAPFYRNPFLNPPARPPYPWRPSVNVFGGFDALFPSVYGMGVALNTASAPATVDVLGVLPVNTPPVGDRPLVPHQATTANTGGSIPPGSYLIAIAGGPVSEFVAAVVPVGTSTNKIIVSGVTWTAAATGIGVFMGPDSQHMFGLDPSAWTGSSLDGFGNPTVFTITALQATGPLTQADGPGLPDLNFTSLLLLAKQVIHGGAWGSAPSSIGSSGGHATATFAGASWTTNQWAGRYLSSYQSGASGPLNWKIDSNTGDTLTFHTSHGPAAAQVVVMRLAGAHISARTIGDDNLVNFYAPSGVTVDGEIGNLVRIIAGTGAGQPPIPIASNTATVVTLAAEWYIQPDSTSVWIIEAPSWLYKQQTDTLHFDGTIPIPSTGQVVGSIPILNFKGGSLLVEAVALDSDDRWSIERFAPFREIYVPPNIIPANAGYFTITPSGGNAAIDLANGFNQRLVLNGSAVNFIAPSYTGGSIVAGLTFTLYPDQDGTGGRAVPTFTGGPGGFVSTVHDQIQALFDGTASTRTAVVFTFHGSYWSIDSIVSGSALL